jgi:predicted amidohydrolase
MAKEHLLKGDFLVATFQQKTVTSYEANLERLLSYIKKSDAKLIVTEELALTDFDYEHFEEASLFYAKAIKKLLDVVESQIVVLTFIVKEKSAFYNRAFVLHQHQIVHQQNKHKLFTLGEEKRYFSAGDEEEIVPFEIEGVRYGLLICFELRFKELWKRVEGVDVVLIPARWGKTRKNHLETLSEALAIMNQSFVVVSNSADDDMASSSAIISAWGEAYRDDSLEVVEKKIALKEVKRVRRLIKMH